MIDITREIIKIRNNVSEDSLKVGFNFDIKDLFKIPIFCY